MILSHCAACIPNGSQGTVFSNTGMCCFVWMITWEWITLFEYEQWISSNENILLLLLSCRPGSAHKLCCITFQTKNPFLLRKQLEDLCIFLKGGWRRRLAVIKCVCVVGVASFSTNCEFKQARKAWRCDSITPETITLYHWATEQGDASYRFCIYERKTYMRQFPLYRLGHREDTWMQKEIKNFLLEHWHWTVLLKVKQIKRKQDGRKVWENWMIELREAIFFLYINTSHKALDMAVMKFSWKYFKKLMP